MSVIFLQGTPGVRGGMGPVGPKGDTVSELYQNRF